MEVKGETAAVQSQIHLGIVHLRTLHLAPIRQVRLQLCISICVGILSVLRIT